jgi:hypothetical protein
MNAHVRIQTMRRQALEAKIEEMIALLDLLDGDPDLEDSGDTEPSLGEAGLITASGVECDLEWDTSDAEPAGDESDFSAKFFGGSGL